MQIDSRVLPKVGSAIPLLAVYDGGNGSVKLIIEYLAGDRSLASTDNRPNLHLGFGSDFEVPIGT